MQPNPHIKYFKRPVDGEDIVPRPLSWGGSSIYYETSEEGFPIRQIQLFELGVVLTYDNEHYHDDYGWRDGNCQRSLKVYHLGSNYRASKCTTPGDKPEGGNVPVLPESSPPSWRMYSRCNNNNQSLL
jgi:hypothetical protein